MSLFREDPPFCLLSGLLERFCIKENGAYLINHIVYKKMRYYEYYDEWLLCLKPYYHLSKQVYTTRKISYNGFTTILRQLCKHFDLEYSYMYDKNEQYKYLKYYITI